MSSQIQRVSNWYKWGFCKWSIPLRLCWHASVYFSWTCTVWTLLLPQQYRCAELLSQSVWSQHAGAGQSHCTLLMQGPCLLEALVKETLCLEASTDPLSKLGLGPSLQAWPEELWVFGTCANLLPWLHSEMKGVDLEKFKERVSLSVHPHLLFLPLPVNLPLSFTQFPHSFSKRPLVLSRPSQQPSLTICLVPFVCLALCYRSVPDL